MQKKTMKARMISPAEPPTAAPTIVPVGVLLDLFAGSAGFGICSQEKGISLVVLGLMAALARPKR
jgi:hypothetical protein